MPLSRRSTATSSSVCGSSPAVPGWKRSLDVTFCLIALPVLALTTFAAAVIVSVTSPGPIFFRQERIGQLGRRFQLFRFRTLHGGNEPSGSSLSERPRARTDQPRLENRGDRRLIPGGWFARSSGLAGLPQVLNILQGEMSLVGPRPCYPFEYERSSALERRRLHCRPGLTGLAQILPTRGGSTDRAVELELHYAKHRSPTLEASILVKTVPVLLRRIVNAVRPRSASHSSPESGTLPPPSSEIFELK